MNRVIKFRGRKTNTGKLIYGYFCYDWNSKGDIKPMIQNSLTEYATSFSKSIIDIETLSQFTGLTDKNGKEIYEGDILQWISSNPFSLGELRTVKVDYIQAQYWCSGRVVGVYLAELLANERCEVIGNVFENKQLLNQ